MDACHCKDFSRAAVMRAAAAQAAQAGKGLRAIEPGMPLPAGTGLSRRSFLARSSGLALAVFGGGALAPRAFEEGIADAMAAGPDTVLVSIFLSGGLDSLSLLAPVGDARYPTLRPNLQQAADPTLGFRDDTRLQWHPSATALKTLHESDRLTVIPAIGYDHPNQSHFTSRHFWEVGQLDEMGQIGWMGRWLDRYGRPDNPLQGLSLDSTLAPALAASGVPVAAVAQPDRFALSARDVNDATLRTRINQSFGALGRLATSDAQLAGARGAAAQVVDIQDQLAPLYNTQPSSWGTPAGAAYPANSGFARKLQVLAKMLAMGLPIRCVALDGNGGYDTHDNQANTLNGNLDQLSKSLSAFQADLEGRALADRVVVHVWSEFGRRPAENGSGTDHGAGGISFLMGSPNKLKTGLVGEFPGLATLDSQQNLRATADFRAVYKGLIDDWLGGSSADVLPGAGSFTAPALFK
jgi:uncharacterized protein (DUF1501 family)